MSDLGLILAEGFGDIANLLVIILIGIVAGLQALFRWIVNRLPVLGPAEAGHEELLNRAGKEA